MIKFYFLILAIGLLSCNQQEEQDFKIKVEKVITTCEELKKSNAQLKTDCSLIFAELLDPEIEGRTNIVIVKFINYNLPNICLTVNNSLDKFLFMSKMTSNYPLDKNPSNRSITLINNGRGEFEEFCVSINDSSLFYLPIDSTYLHDDSLVVTLLSKDFKTGIDLNIPNDLYN